ncbi:hypothetical protein QTT33_005065 [Salmonella enterica]|nr:hypothetical protein [Salmonella enterica]
MNCRGIDDRDLDDGNRTIIIYSPDFIISTALKYLQRKSNAYTIKQVYCFENLFLSICTVKPKYIVLDIPARDNVFLLCAIRRKFPIIPIIITQHHHLFSDYIVASWFGNIWLREHRALMDANEYMPTDCVDRSCFAGTENTSACGRYCKGSNDSLLMIKALQRWLGQRLEIRLCSRKGTNIILNWLEKGGSPAEVGKRFNRTDKLIYHYRRLVKQELGFNNTLKEFIPSISVKGGMDVPTECSSLCLLRIQMRCKCAEAE